MKSLFLVVFWGTAYVPPILLEVTESVAECESFRILLSRSLVSSCLFFQLLVPCWWCTLQGTITYPNDWKGYSSSQTAFAWDMLHLRKSNIDTTHDGLENVSPACPFWVSMLDFRGVLGTQVFCVTLTSTAIETMIPHYPP